MAILDTNLILDNPDILNSKFEEGIMLPMEVIKELDNNKTRPGTAGYNARKATRILLDMLLNKRVDKNKCVNENDTTITFLYTDKDMIPSILSPVDIELLRLSSVVCEKILTSDAAMSIYGMVNGVNIEYVKKEPEIYTGMSKHIVRKEFVDTIAGNGIVSADNLGSEVESKLHANEFLTLIDETNFEHTTIGKYDVEHNIITPIKYKIKAFGIDARPRNIEQNLFLNLLTDPSIGIVTCSGQAGGGKTLLSLAAGIEQTTCRKNPYDKVCVFRSLEAVDEEIGFLPGGADEKVDRWHDALYDAFEVLMFKNNLVKQMMTREQTKQTMENYGVEIGILTFIRGRSLPKSFIIIDEAQNITPDVMRTIVTRCGDKTKIVILGDITQIDNPKCTKESNGLTHIINSLSKANLPEYAHISLDKGERSRIANIGIKFL